MSTYIDKIIDTIEEYRSQGKMAIFVGAGVSRLSGYPSWSELVLSMARELGYPINQMDIDGNECLSSNEYLKIPQMYYVSKGEIKYFEKVRSQLNILKEPNDIHKLLMRIKPNHILTTNYDTLIEQASNRAGLSYSVVNSDDKVASSPTQNYILKVHGDFQNNNFVLKESDYLNYDKNFKIIETIMKAIISSHLIIFIGYSLGDYNIKLIINWVKDALNDKNIAPIFIHTDKNELSKFEIDYYKGENIKVVDINKYIGSGTLGYIERYSTAIKLLFDRNRNEEWFKSDVKTIEYFYNIFEPLKDVNYLRAEDVCRLFPSSKLWINSISCDDFEYLLKVNSYKLSEKRRNQYRYLITRLRNSGIDNIACSKENKNAKFISRIKRGLIIDNNTFNSSYNEIAERIDKYGDGIDDQYNKAYDLYWLGRLDKSMEIYYKILADCYSHERWVLYFFTQINLFYIRQIAIQIAKDSRIKSILGNKIFDWNEKDINEMEISHVLADIPSKIRRYSFFQRLTDKIYYNDDYRTMYKQNFNISQSIAKKSVTVAGMSPDEKSKIMIYDAINFIYCNKITFDKYSEHKDFVKIALEYAYKGMINQYNSIKLANGESGNCCYIDIQDCLLIARNFNYSDLVVFFQKDKGDELILDMKSMRLFEQYIHDLISYFKKSFFTHPSKDRNFEYFYLITEMKNALFLASYYAETEKIILECVRYILLNLPGDEFASEKEDIFKRYIKHMSDPRKIRRLLVDSIVTRIQNLRDGDGKIDSQVKRHIAIETRIINNNFVNYRSKKILQMIKNIDKSIATSIEPLLTNIL